MIHRTHKPLPSSFAIQKQSPLCGAIALHAPKLPDRSDFITNHKTRTRLTAIAAITLLTAPLTSLTPFLAQPAMAHEAAAHTGDALTPAHIAELHSGEILMTKEGRQFVLVAPLGELWEIDAAGEILAQHSYAFDGSDFLLLFTDGREVQIPATDPAPLGVKLAGATHDLAYFYTNMSARAFVPTAPKDLRQSMLFATGPGFAETPNEHIRHWEADGAFIDVQLLDGSIRRFHWTELDKHLISITDRLSHD